jgi:outer membrane protein assembly factor BamA
MGTSCGTAKAVPSQVQSGFPGHAFSSAKLRSVFPLKKGALFERDKIASGLDSLRNVYGKSGFLDFMSVPDTENVSSGTILLSITVEEGPRYRMGKLEIVAKEDIAEKLQSAWQLPEGAVFDLSYIDRYLRAIDRCSLQSSFRTMCRWCVTARRPWLVSDYQSTRMK